MMLFFISHSIPPSILPAADSQIPDKYELARISQANKKVFIDRKGDHLGSMLSFNKAPF